jgi:hypothetical protein
MFEIVKRQHIRQAGHLVPANQLTARSRRAPDMLGKQKYVFGEIQEQVFLEIMSGLCRADIDHESNQVS